MFFIFFFNDTATTEIYTTYDTLSLHDALPIYLMKHPLVVGQAHETRERAVGAGRDELEIRYGPSVDRQGRQGGRQLERHPVLLAYDHAAHQRSAMRRDVLDVTAHDSPLTLHGKRVQAALGFAGAAPPPRSLGLAGGGGAGARPTPDARVALVEQRVIRHAVFPDVAPYVRSTPVRQRKHFHDRAAIHLVVLDQLRGRAGGGLILPHRADPRVEVDHGARQRLDLANRAAAVRVRLVQWTRVGQGLQVQDMESVALGEAL